MFEVILIGIPVIGLVLCFKKLGDYIKRPKKAEKAIEQLGSLKGKSFNDIKSILGKPKEEITLSDGQRKATWISDNGFGRYTGGGTYAGRAFIVIALFDNNLICIDYEKSTQNL